MSIVTGFFFSVTFKEYSEHTLKDEHFITFAGSIASVFGGIRFQWGPILEKLGFKAVYGAILVL